MKYTQIRCNICKNMSPRINYKETWTLEQYEYNYYQYGVMECVQNARNSYLKWKRSHGRVPANDSNEKFCEECDKVKTKHFCQQCDTAYCKACYDATHLSSRTLRLHTYMEILGGAKCLEDKNICRAHMKATDLFCKDCEIECCFYCLKNEHQGHEHVKLVKHVSLDRFFLCTHLLCFGPLKLPPFFSPQNDNLNQELQGVVEQLQQAMLNSENTVKVSGNF